MPEPVSAQTGNVALSISLYLLEALVKDEALPNFSQANADAVLSGLIHNHIENPEEPGQRLVLQKLAAKMSPEARDALPIKA